MIILGGYMIILCIMTDQYNKPVLRLNRMKLQWQKHGNGISSLQS